MRHEPGDSPRGTRAASTGSSWVSLRREEMEGGQEGRERGRRARGRQEGRNWDLVEGRNRRQLLGRANFYIIQTEHE